MTRGSRLRIRDRRHGFADYEVALFKTLGRRARRG
jgi:hypothetical protein